MADEKRQIILDLLARNKMRKDTNEAADDLDKVGNSAEKADKRTGALGETSEKTEKKVDSLGKGVNVVAGNTEELGKKSEDAAKKTDKLGGSLDDTKRRISGLDDTIGNLKKEIAGMAAAWADASTSVEKNDISKAIRKTQAELRTTTKQRSILSDLLPDDQELEQESKKIEKKLSDSAVGIGDAITPALIGGAVAAAPAVGAVISGAIVGGVGLGGIAGGFLIASKDPRVKAAAGAMKTEIGDELKTAADPFVDVSLKGIDRVGRSIRMIDFTSVFKDAASQAGPVIDGVVSLVDDLGSAIKDVVHESGPEVKAIGDGIGQIGGALARGLRELGSNTDANADALKNLFTVVEFGIDATFGLVDALTKIYEAGRKISGGGLIDTMQALDAASTPIAGKLTDIAKNSIDAATNTQDLAKTQDDAARAARGERDALAAVSDELRKQTDPAFAVLDAMDKVRDSQKEAADATHKYGSESEQARAANRKLAEAAIDLQGDVGKLGASFDGNLTPTMKRTLKAAGLTKDQIADVENELKRAKRAADAYAGKYVAEIITNYTYNVGGNDYNREANRGAFSGKRAAGGPIVRGMPYLVGENGPEVVVPDASGRVLNASGSRGLMVQGGMNGLRGSGQAVSGPSVATVNVKGSADQGVATLINYLIRTNLIEVTVS
jgi:methyl-accepting chemotaxis protein